MAKNGTRKVVSNNKKAFHDYFVDDRIEAGVQLFGTEVKSVRNGSVNMKDAYCYIDKQGEMYATGIYISPSSIVIRCATANCCCTGVRLTACSV